MATPPLSDDLAREAVEAVTRFGNKAAAARGLGIAPGTFDKRYNIGVQRGFEGTRPVLPGYYLSKETAVYNQDGDLVREFIQQKPEHGAEFEVPDGHAVKGVSALIDADGRIIQQWVKTKADENEHLAAVKAAIEEFREKPPHAKPASAPKHTSAELLCQYTITDAHLGALAWNEETGGGDYDLSIGEALFTNWFAAAVASAPPAKRAVLAQLGDFLHYDSFKSVTPEHGNLLDGDSRYPKMVRTAIRVLRVGITQLLKKHEQIDIVMCDANHDPAGTVWLREMFSVYYEKEPRVRVDTNPGTYSYIEHGNVSLFYHHGHRRKTDSVDSMLAGKFRQVYGRTRFSYAHTGHKHQDELKTTDLMKVEQHETLAAPDAYGSNWLSGRSAKVITYHSQHGEVGRIVLTPEMVTA